jgi:hypothetical protein
METATKTKRFYPINRRKSHELEDFFLIWHQGGQVPLPTLTHTELRLIRHFRDYPNESRSTAAFTFGMSINTLSSAVTSIYRKWSRPLIDDPDPTKTELLKVALDVLFVYELDHAE